MKRFITAILLSLTVIVCEQQTLFAPHYTDFGGRLAGNINESLHCHGLVLNSPEKDRLIPVASSDSLIAIVAIAAAKDSNQPSVGDNAVSGRDDLTFGYNGDAPFGVRGGSVCPTAGADKVTSYSPNDPVFFTHHANIDYLWE